MLQTSRKQQMELLAVLINSCSEDALLKTRAAALKNKALVESPSKFQHPAGWLLDHCFSYLSRKNLARVESTCARWRMACKDGAGWTAVLSRPLPPQQREKFHYDSPFKHFSSPEEAVFMNPAWFAELSARPIGVNRIVCSDALIDMERGSREYVRVRSDRKRRVKDRWTKFWLELPSIALGRSLTRLNIVSPLDVDELEAIGRLPQLDALSVRCFSLQEMSADSFARLRTLRVSGDSLEISRSLQNARQLLALRTLIVGCDPYERLTGTAFALLGTLKQLTQLEMAGQVDQKLTGNVLQPLAKLTGLRSLTFRNALAFEGRDASFLSSLTNLTELHGLPMKFDDDDFALLTPLTKLTTLALPEFTFGEKLTGAGLSHVQSLTHLVLEVVQSKLWSSAWTSRPPDRLHELAAMSSPSFARAVLQLPALSSLALCSDLISRNERSEQCRRVIVAHERELASLRELLDKTEASIPGGRHAFNVCFSDRLAEDKPVVNGRMPVLW